MTDFENDPVKPTYEQLENALNQALEENTDLKRRLADAHAVLFERTKESRMAQFAVNMARENAYTDQLTQLRNRDGMRYDYAQLAQRSRRKTDKTERIGLFIDIDDFKNINDTYGHQAGDAALQVVGNVLNSTLREEDLVGRFAGDEFMAVLSSDSRDGALKVSSLLQERVSKISSGPVESLSLSIGIAPIDLSKTFDDAIAITDAAMYEAKRQPGKGSIFLLENI